ncbi:MAG TPA: response regulator transcription factor [Acidobacteriota bacterium]|nr:response regulator transcription factor [Acidobacteriota bacterium]
MTEPIRILLVDDHNLFRESLARVLQAENDLNVVGNCSSARAAMTVLERERVDIILLDYDLGEEQGATFQREAAVRGFRGRVLMVTAGMSDRDIVGALENGASGIFLKTGTPAQLVEAIHQVMQGEPWLDPKAMQAVISAATGKSLEPSDGQALSEREKAVMKGIFEGLTNKEIAFRLKISETSVKASIQQLFNKAGVRTRGQLVRIALERREQGWI